jgi:hypothetical protein
MPPKAAPKKGKEEPVVENPYIRKVRALVAYIYIIVGCIELAPTVL